jgi:hypothetical protein
MKCTIHSDCVKDEGLAEACAQEVDVDGRWDSKREGIRFIGKASYTGVGNLYRCLANVGGALCLVEVGLTFSDLGLADLEVPR